MAVALTLLIGAPVVVVWMTAAVVGAIVSLGPGPVVLIELALAIGVPLAVYLSILNRQDRTVPGQAAMRRGLVIGGYLALGFWGVALLLVGACFAIVFGGSSFG